MFLSPSLLLVDCKLQDTYRAYIAKMLADPTLVPTGVIIGDSDLDYLLSPNMQNSRILNAPYGDVQIKFPLIYNGVGKNLSGIIKTFARQVQEDGSIDSVYDYDVNLNWIPGLTPPILSMGYDWNQITFGDTQMGYILFFETLLDYYLTPNGAKERLVEAYSFVFSWNGSPVTPSNWNYVIDNTNGSLLLAKQDTTATPIGLNYRGSITVTGQFSQKIKVITFNY